MQASAVAANTVLLIRVVFVKKLITHRPFFFFEICRGAYTYRNKTQWTNKRTNHSRSMQILTHNPVLSSPAI
ncbi:hypothetical protein [Alicyclobacillus acidoterrestris]|uniref:Uncharacterized protein n=1 Tax=Alicyclobacillus acidoterrestris (strain ATCC 49025 / DSM 3922 / CIP 106132 / NCIMB 13137 / GD3B) TaxID=1356854 RepID=T0D5W1_ALIAG|nr:hypothetical protein [Alicyclobacillus acidoterrestris]EPZ45116.1 hypothetical protein N007_09915 [Alicyclobacillus acidoterrestris ATCC 49025]UNO48403.1 hypothetical protein K1I37_17290 [Alicyclobacillus acidoterrestris]